MIFTLDAFILKLSKCMYIKQVSKFSIVVMESIKQYQKYLLYQLNLSLHTLPSWTCEYYCNTYKINNHLYLIRTYSAEINF